MALAFAWPFSTTYFPEAKMNEFTLVNATLADGKVTNIGVVGGIIKFIGDKVSGENIDAKGLIALPGFVDLHTHLREPGFEQSETVLSGSRAAALGGFTAVHAMANTMPVADTAGVVEQIKSLGDEAGLVQVQPIGAVTVGLEGERLAELGAMANSKAKVTIFSDDGKCVSDPLLMRRALAYVKSFDGVIAQHAQEPRLTENAQMHEGIVSAELGLAGWPSVAEESIIARDVLLAEATGSRLHICHLSTAGSVDIIRWAKQRGIRVTAEVTPHHLLLTDELARTYNPIFKVNPPLRTDADVKALREALIDGTIDIVATDHAPHPLEAKECEWSAAAFGMLGLETAASIAQLVLIDSGKSDWQRFSEVMSLNPAAISKLENQGEALEVGNVANITVIDPRAIRLISGGGASKSSNQPFEGIELPGAVIHTIYRGTFTVRDSKLAK
jgi:dihydroorotase